MIAVPDGAAALKQIEDENEFIDLVITDVQMPEVTGHDILASVRARRSESRVIIITAFGSVEQAVDMVKQGAFQYLTKPFETADLLSVIEQALEQSAVHREQARLRRELRGAPACIIGASRPMRGLFEQIAKAAPSGSTVFITGESGNQEKSSLRVQFMTPQVGPEHSFR